MKRNVKLDSSAATFAHAGALVPAAKLTTPSKSPILLAWRQKRQGQGPGDATQVTSSEDLMKIPACLMRRRGVWLHGASPQAGR